MEEARLVLRRLERIEELEREHAPAPELLQELQALVSDAEEWLRAEPEPRGAVEALSRCREALEAKGQEVVLLAR